MEPQTFRLLLVPAQIQFVSEFLGCRNHLANHQHAADRVYVDAGQS